MAKIIGVICLLLIFLVLGILVIKTKPSNQSQNINPTPSVAPAAQKALDAEKFLIEDIQVGTGSAVKSGDTVSVHYLGTLLDGTKFDSSYDRNEPFTTQIGVGAVIPGWDQGMIGMKVGGKRKLTIPSSLGYGEMGAGRIIPPGAGLIFEIELLDVKPVTQ